MDTSVVILQPSGTSGSPIGGLTSIVASWLNQRVQAKTEQLSHYQLVWAAGIRASCSFNESGLALNRAGQDLIGPNLLAKGEQYIFAFGGLRHPGAAGGRATITADRPSHQSEYRRNDSSSVAVG